jgi:hypothetical protein
MRCLKGEEWRGTRKGRRMVKKTGQECQHATKIHVPGNPACQESRDARKVTMPGTPTCQEANTPGKQLYKYARKASKASMPFSMYVQWE